MSALPRNPCWHRLGCWLDELEEPSDMEDILQDDAMGGSDSLTGHSISVYALQFQHGEMDEGEQLHLSRQ